MNLELERKCKKCNDTGWLCGCDLTKPWEGAGNCGCGESGKNCICNKNGDFGTDYKITHSINKDEITAIH